MTALVLPSDLQDEDAVLETPHAHGFSHTSSVPSTGPTVPPLDALHAAADVLCSGRRVAVLAGAGALGATEVLTRVCDRLGAGLAKALLGKTVLDDRLPWVTGAIGLLGTRPSYDLMKECDTLLVVGSTMPYSEYYPAPGQARAVQIDVDGTRCGLRYPTEVNLVGDARQTLEALDEVLAARSSDAPAAADPGWRHDVARWNDRWRSWGAERAEAQADPLNPERIVRALSDRLPDDVMVAVDCGTGTAWYARDLDVRPSMLASLSGNLLSMGGGIPYAIAAKNAHPDRPVLAIIGDGAMQMNGLSELVTVARDWRTWADPRLLVLVLNNRDLSFVAWETRAMQGEVPFDQAMRLPDVPYGEYARLLGLDGARVDDPSEVDGVLDRAWASDRPFVIDAVVDKDWPMIPPHVTLDQVVKTAASQLKGDPALPGVVAQGLRATVGAAARSLRRRDDDPSG